MDHDPALAPQLASLTGLSVGWWSSKRHTSIWMLVLPQQQRLVLLVEEATRAPRRGLVGKAATRLSARSPFASKTGPGQGWVCAFEADFDGILGIDYLHPLVRPGRLVLEARRVTKREFKSVSRRGYGLFGVRNSRKLRDEELSC